MSARPPHQTVRARLEANERRMLSPLAARSADAQRDRAEEESGARTRFQRDRDRVLHTKAFRRLKHKTQVFIAPEGDHYRTRLTHTLEVTQIARTIARALCLNEDLVEAIGLAHDLGHTPFGHAGEAALSRAIGQPFRHNNQSLRVVEVLENNGEGLNLTAAVRDGIALHSKVRGDIEATAWGTAQTLEGQIIKVADSVAYINHDIDDALRAGILRLDDLPRAITDVLGTTHAERLNAMVCDLIDNNWWATGEAPAPPDATIGMSAAVREATNGLREYMFREVYLAPPVNNEDNRVGFVVGQLFEHFISHPDEVPADLRAISEQRGDDAMRSVIDYIAGMTDRYAFKVFNAIYVPRIWSA